jgi:hypothetical protein
VSRATDGSASLALPGLPLPPVTFRPERWNQVDTVDARREEAAGMPPPRSRARANLKRFEALDPATLTPEERKFRDFAIRALKVELELRAKGLIGPDGEVAAPATPTARKRRAPKKRRGAS